MRRIKQAAAFALAAALCAGQGMPPVGSLLGDGGFPGPVIRAYGAQDVVEIHTAKDLVTLSEGSVLDSYTAGKTFELMSDIDLTGSGFKPVASFGGAFHGNGHVISGFSWDGAGSNVGLFRFVEPGGSVENLKVRVTVKPGGSRKNVGGIVGTNRGQISGCTVSGRIWGSGNTGGIAGQNGPGGLIEGCVNTANVLGLEATGGIVGFNEGIAEGCENRGQVNSSEHGADEDEGKTPQPSGIPLDGKILDAEKVYHTGGIAGNSTGTIRRCTNKAVIGYPHSGYNTGGIAGIQNGYITECSNTGEIRGRKDTGGIVGQFEPYVRMRYEEDTIQKVQNQMDVLLDQLDAFGDMLGDTGDDTVANVDALRADVKDVRSGLQGNKTYYYENTKSFSGDLDVELDRVEASINDFELELSDRNIDADATDLESDIRRLKNLRQELKDSLVSDPAKAREILDEMADLLSDIEETAKGMPVSLIDDVNDTTDDINDQVDSVRASIEGTRALIRENKDKLFTDLEATDEDMGARIDSTAASLDALFERLKSANTQTQGQMDAIRSQVSLISDTISGRVDELKEERDGDLIADVSDEHAEEPGSGMVSGCENTGRVESDGNTGGIAGIIGMELTLDPENDLEVDGEHSLKIDRTARASVRGCVNRGMAVSTNDYAGGIVGRADAGSLTGNSNFANVESKEGSYVGGIAGSSANMARDNRVLCQMKGQDYIGGVAGKGKHVIGNLVMASIIPGEPGEYRGTVAGDADGDISGNCFVWEGLAAVDGVTYESQAKPLTYEEMVGLDSAPEEFCRLEVAYLADGRELKRVAVPYGNAAPEQEAPDIPAKDGYYAFWEDRGQSCVTANLFVEAQYRLWTTTVSSSLRDGGLPALLAEGNYYPGTDIDAEELDGALWPEQEGYNAVKAYRYEIRSPEPDGWESRRLRVYVGDLEDQKALRVTMFNQDGEPMAVKVAVKEELDGSYLVFNCAEAAGICVVMARQAGYGPAAAALAVLAAMGVWLWRRKRKPENRKLEEVQAGKP